MIVDRFTGRISMSRFPTKDDLSKDMKELGGLKDELAPPKWRLIAVILVNTLFVVAGVYALVWLANSVLSERETLKAWDGGRLSWGMAGIVALVGLLFLLIGVCWMILSWRQRNSRIYVC